jgi:hypothetical protein
MAITFPDYYDFITEYTNLLDGTIKFRNTWTFFSGTTPVLGEGIVAALANYAVGLVHEDCAATKFSVYNWARGRQTYPLGEPVFTFDTSDTGTAGTNWPHLDSDYLPAGGEVCLRIDHDPTTGNKPGRNFQRGLLGKNDITSLSGGKITLVPSVADLQTDLNAWLTSSGMSPYVGAGTGGQHLAIVRYGGSPKAVQGSSTLFQVQVVDATTNKQTRKNKK